MYSYKIHDNRDLTDECFIEMMRLFTFYKILIKKRQFL